MNTTTANNSKLQRLFSYLLRYSHSMVAGGLEDMS